MENDDYYLAELEDHILNTVSSYVKDVPRPFGLLLSGGFDSGLLAALTKPDYVFTVRFPYGVVYDESRYADAIITHLGLTAKTTILVPRKEDFDQFFKEAVEIMGEPVPHFSLVPFYMTMKLIQDQKKTVHILSGEGPDEYLGGYARQIIIDELQKFFRIPELRNYHETIRKWLLMAKKPVVEYGMFLGYPVEKVIHYNALWEEKKYPLQGVIGKMDMELGVIEKMEQKLASACGINLHYPYINNEFSEYCYRLPDHLKIRDGVTKWAFRQICRKYLPAFMMDRAKMGGPVAPVNEWLGLGGGFDKKEYLKRQEAILNATHSRNR